MRPKLSFQSAKAAVDTGNLRRFFVLPKGVVSIMGYDKSVGGAPCLQLTSKGLLGNCTPKRVEVNVAGEKITLHQKSILISGKFPYEYGVRILSRLYPGAQKLPFKINNSTYTWHYGKTVKIELLAGHLKKNLGASKVEYEPELFPAIKIKHNSLDIKIFQNGIIIASGSSVGENLQEIVEGLIPTEFQGGHVKRQIPKRLNLQAKRENMRKHRYPEGNPNNIPTGFYVAPNVGGVMRQYKVPKNPKIAATKVRKAYAKFNVRIPAKVREIFGYSPEKNQEVAFSPGSNFWNNLGKNKSPNASWSAVKNKYYIRPTTGGQPKFFKIPKDLVSGKRTMLKAYKSKGIAIPPAVRKIFNVTPEKNIKNVKMYRTNVSNKGVIRVDGKACMRYTISELQRIAAEQKIPYIGLTKAKLCSQLVHKKNSPVSQVKANFVLGGIPHVILRTAEKMRRGGREKALKSFTLSELRGFANKLGGSGSKTSKTNLIKLITKRHKPSPPQRKKTPSPPPQRSPSTVSSSINSNFAKNIEEKMKLNSIRQRLANEYEKNTRKPIKLNGEQM